MARGINKTISIGNLCADPESRAMPNGNAVTNVRIAMNESYKDKNTGQVVERVEYMSVVFFNRLAEIAAQYLKKGSKIYVEGSLRTRKYQAQDGSDRWSTEIVASEMQMLDGKESSVPAGAGYQGGAQGSAPPRSNSGRDAGRGSKAADYRAAREGSGGGGGFGDFDDIPF